MAAGPVGFEPTSLVQRRTFQVKLARKTLIPDGVITLYAMSQTRKFVFYKTDVIFWILALGAVVSLILRRLFSPPLDDAFGAFTLGAIFYLYGRISRLEGRVTLLPTGEEVRRIIREELDKTLKR